MSTRAYTPPAQITPAMIPLVAFETIDVGNIVCFEAINTGIGVRLQDNRGISNNLLPAIGIAANYAEAGQLCYVVVAGPITFESTHLNGAQAGEMVGTDFSILSPGAGIAVDIGGSDINNTVIVQSMSIVGYVITSDSVSVTVLVQPSNYLVAGAGPAVPTFHDNITPTTFTTNHEYVLPSAPNPTASLQVFIDDTSLGTDGCNKLLVQGVDYHLTTGNTHIVYDVSPTATNKIVCFFRS